jgi:hypothetical protein
MVTGLEARRKADRLSVLYYLGNVRTFDFLSNHTRGH